MTTLADLPSDRYVLALLKDGTLAAVPHGDPVAALARRWLHGKREPGTEEAIRAWLGEHPQYEITRLPAPEPAPAVAVLPCGQLTLWEAA